MALYPFDLSVSSLSEMAAEVSAWLNNHNQLGANQNHRLNQICRIVLNKSGQITNPSDEGYRELVLAKKDLQEYWFIIRILGERLLSPPFYTRMRMSLQDPVYPEQSKNTTHGRNTQFELFLAAILSRSNCLVSEYGENLPDWLIESPIHKWTLEAKRIRSWKKAKTRIKEAAEQISNSKIGGIVALDISSATNRSYQPLTEYCEDDKLKQAQRMRAEFLLETELSDLNKWTKQKPVGLVILHDFIIRPAAVHSDGRESPWSLIGLWDYVYLSRDKSPSRTKYEEFKIVFDACLPDL